MNPIFRAAIQKGKVIFRDVDKFNLYVLKFEGKEVDVIIRKRKKTRTNPQNRYLWGVCYELISEATGYTTDEIHATMRAIFLTDETSKIHVVRSTTSLTTNGMVEYIDKIKQWASQELNCYIPDPDEVFEEKTVSPEILAEEEKTRARMKEICKKHFNGRDPSKFNNKELQKFSELLNQKGAL